jgi:membrane protein YdbS with pleckstrin-like domain
MDHIPYVPSFTENLPDGQEHVIWREKSAQFINLGYFTKMAVGFLACLFIGALFAHLFILFSLIFVVLGAYRYLYTRTKLYTLTDQRLIQQAGLFNRVTFEIELYRIKDIHLAEPFLFRLFKIGNIRIISSQKTVHFDLLPGIKQPMQRWNEIRNYVEKRRTEKGVRESDVSY